MAKTDMPDTTTSNKTKILVALLLGAALVVGVVLYYFSAPQRGGLDSSGAPLDIVALKEVETGNENGKASRYVNLDNFFHDIVVELDTPADGSSYEGWLYNEAGKRVSTGKFKIVKEPIYTLSFISPDESLLDYQKIVVTLELDDGNSEPGKAVLEGYFEY